MNAALVQNLGRGALGMAFLILVCYVLSTNRSAINWKLVLYGILAQVMFAMGVLHTTVFGQPVFWMFFTVILALTIFRKGTALMRGTAPVQSSPPYLIASVVWQAAFIGGMLLAPRIFGEWSGAAMAISTIVVLAIAYRIGAKFPELLKWNILFSSIVLVVFIFTKVTPPDVFRLILQAFSNVFVSLVNISHKGTEFLFGRLADDKQSWAYVFAIQVLPNIIFFAALSSVLFYLGILQKIVYILAYLLNKLFISGAESMSTAANIFLGQTEAPLMIRPYLDKMTRSEILLIMVGGMANTAGSVLAAYVGMLGGGDEAQSQFFALHMLSQSLMSAPAAIVCAKILFPQTQGEVISKDLRVPKEKLGDNFLDALSMGTTDGLKLAVNVGAMLIVFTAMMWVVNELMGWVGGLANINDDIDRATAGRYKTLSLDLILGYLFAPVAWLIGVDRIDMVSIGQLLGVKTIINEFQAYIVMGEMKSAGVIQSHKSMLIATYALCGFANFASIGIQIGGISQLAPNQRKNLTELGFRALVGGTIACLMCGCVAGALYTGSQ